MGPILPFARRSIIQDMGLEQDIRQKALELGFDAAGITDASPIGREHAEHFQAWLQSGYAGRMEYMHRNLEKRVDPSKLLDGARSVVVVALNYKPSVPEAAAEGPASDAASEAGYPVGRIAQYAQYEDYHGFIKSLLRELADFIRRRTDGTQRCKLCVDSAPVAEKALAVRAGLGSIGKNHLLIHPHLGPQILLGELITTVRLAPDEPGVGDCGGCDLCLRACPTGALRRDGFLDVRACISYLTQYEPSSRAGNWLFGCDECLLACPHQKHAPTRTNTRFRHYAERGQLCLRDVVGLTPEAFAERFGDSPLAKAGLETFTCNAKLCLEHSGQGARKMSMMLEGNSHPRTGVPGDMSRRR